MMTKRRNAQRKTSRQNIMNSGDGVIDVSHRDVIRVFGWNPLTHSLRIQYKVNDNGFCRIQEILPTREVESMGAVVSDFYAIPNGMHLDGNTNADSGTFTKLEIDGYGSNIRIKKEDESGEENAILPGNTT